MFRILFAGIFIITFLGTLLYGAEFPECDNEPVNSFVAVANNCSKAIYCNDVNSTIVDCDNNNPYFSPADGMCYNNFSVCDNRPFGLDYTTISTTFVIPTIATTIATTSSSIKPTVKPTLTTTTNSDLSVINTTSNEETSIASIAPTQSTTTTTKRVPLNTLPPTKTTTSTKNTSTTNHPIMILQCPSVDDPNKPLFLPHPKSCSKYYLCYHGVATLMKCANMLHFDVTQQTCNTVARAKCRVHSAIPREQCLPHIEDVYPHPTNCNYYYLCEYGFLMVMQCPFNMEWDYERKICAMKSKAKCYNAFLINYLTY